MSELQNQEILRLNKRLNTIFSQMVIYYKELVKANRGIKRLLEKLKKEKQKIEEISIISHDAIYPHSRDWYEINIAGGIDRRGKTFILKLPQGQKHGNIKCYKLDKTK